MGPPHPTTAPARMSQLVGDLDIPDPRLHIGDRLPVDRRGLAVPLVLMQQGDGRDEVQVLPVVAPGPGPPVSERQPIPRTG